MARKAQIKFGTDGWRAIIGDTFIVENVRTVSEAIAAFVQGTRKSKKGVVVGYDTRFLSEKFAEECALVLAGRKLPVYLIDRPTPTPVTAYAIKAYRAAGAVMLTASHNPPEYNGIKFIPEYAGPASPKITSQIEKNIIRVQRSSFAIAPASSRLIKKVNPLEAYLAQLKRLIDFGFLQETKLRVGLDPLYGAGIGIMERIFEEAKCDVRIIHNKRDVLFGGSMPDPDAENLADLAELVVEQKASLGVALDGDGDRFGAVDSSGIYLQANQLLVLALLHLLKNREFKGKVVRSIATTHMLDKVAADFGMETVETPVGFKYIAEVMRSEPVVLGGEESGGLSILGHIPEKDGLLAGLLLTELVAREKKSLLTTLKAAYQKYGLHITRRIDIPCSSEQKEELLEKLRHSPPDLVGELKLEKVVTTDGVKYLFGNNCWMLARPSGTEPLVRVYIEADSNEHFSLLEGYSRSFSLTEVARRKQ